MSGITRLLSLVGRLPTVLRTLSALRPAQAKAQVHHMFFGLPEPYRGAGDVPALAVERVQAAFLEAAPHIAANETANGLRIELLRREIVFPRTLSEFDWTAAPHGPLVAYHLHEQAYLRHANVSPARRAEIILDWIDRHESGVGWDPHPISLRLLSWGKLLLTPGALPEDAALRAKMMGSMRDQAESLSRGLEVRLQANHLLSNMLGVVWAGLLLDGADAAGWRERGALLVREFSAQVHADGGHEERSPMYHSLLLENVLDLLNLARASEHADAALVSCLEGGARRMGEALRVYTGPDGRIGLFADSAWGVSANPESLARYAASLGVAAASDASTQEVLTLLPESGYARLASEDFDVIVSTHGPSPAHQPGHAHCDVLGFELFVGDERVVTDTGVFEYQVGPNRSVARSTESHATLQFDGREQSEIWSAHRVGGRATTVAPRTLESGAVEFSVVGWGGGPKHVRRIQIRDAGFEVVDQVSQGGHDVISRFPLAPGIQIEGGAVGERISGSLVLRSEQTGTRIRVELADALEWQLESGEFFPTFHERVPRLVLVGRGRTPLDASLRFERA